MAKIVLALGALAVIGAGLDGQLTFRSLLDVDLAKVAVYLVVLFLAYAMDLLLPAWWQDVKSRWRSP